MNFVVGQSYNGKTIQCNFPEDMRDIINNIMSGDELIEKKIVEFGTTCYISVNYGSNMGKVYYYIYFYDGIDYGGEIILYSGVYYNGSVGGDPYFENTINEKSFDIPESSQPCSAVSNLAYTVTNYMTGSPRDPEIMNNRYIKSNGSWIPLIKSKSILIKSNGSWIPYKNIKLDNSVTNLFSESTIYGMFNDTNTYSTVYITPLKPSDQYDKGFYVKSSDGNTYPYVYQLQENRSSDTLSLNWGYIFANGSRYNTQPYMSEGDVIPEVISNSTEAIELAKDALLQKTGILYNNFTVSDSKSYSLTQYFQGSLSGQSSYTIDRYNIINTDTGRNILVTNVGQAYVDATGTEDSGNSSGGGLACLTGDTLVKTKNNYIPIKNLEVGNVVLSYNKTTQIVEEKRIYKTYSHRPSKIYNIIIETGDIIKATSSHEFYTDKGIISTEQLKVGDNLIDVNGKFVEILDIKCIENDEEVYEIWVEDNNNYIITDNDILSSCEEI